MYNTIKYYEGVLYAGVFTFCQLLNNYPEATKGQSNAFEFQCVLCNLKFLIRHTYVYLPPYFLQPKIILNTDYITSHAANALMLNAFLEKAIRY